MDGESSESEMKLNIKTVYGIVCWSLGKFFFFFRTLVKLIFSAVLILFIVGLEYRAFGFLSASVKMQKYGLFFSSKNLQTILFKSWEHSLSL